jgi:hypothetical protein
LLQAGQVECAHGLADQRELRDQVVGRGRTVRLVVGIKLVAEGNFRLVEHNREMCRPVIRRHIAQELPQHVAEAKYGIDLQSVGFAVQGRQRVIGAENVGGTVDQKDMVALAGGLGGDRLGGGFRGGFYGGLFGTLGHGRNLRIFAAIDSLSEAVFGVLSRLSTPSSSAKAG